MRLLIKFPTRSRPDKFKQVLEMYIDYLSGKHDVRFVITCDEDDETMNNSEVRKWFASLQESGVNLTAYYGDSKTKIEACNANMEGETFDVGLLASDDMIPQLREYDDVIAQVFDGTFPEFDGAVKFNDGLRNDALCTLPVMGKKLYDAIGHWYHPDYTSIYCDTEMTELCMMLGKFAVCETCIIKHEWVPGGHEESDELHTMQESPEMYEKDGGVFNKRKNELQFDVQEVAKRLNHA